MYGKVFTKMYEGSMVGAGADVFALWPYIIANADMQGMVELNPPLIAFKLGMTEAEVVNVISKFLAPDPRSRSKELEGRKLECVGEFLYHVVNFEYYRKIRNAEDRREAVRGAVEKHRKAKRGQPLAGEVENVRRWANGEQPDVTPQ